MTGALGQIGRGADGLRATAAVRALAGVAARYWEVASYAALLVTAAAMRFWDLGSRAIHHDESLHAYYAWRLSEGMGYTHDPMMHGPFQFESTAALFFVFGAGDVTARVLYAAAGSALVAMPWLFRARLGRAASLAAAVMLTFSPAMLYFSRFARNDILAAVWTLGLVVCLWRYLDEGRNRYLYAGAALLALFFATKETAFIFTAVLGLYLAAMIALRRLAVFRRVARRAGRNAAYTARVAAAYVRRGIDLSRLSREGAFFLMLFTLSLPQGAALSGLLQDTVLLRWSGLTLARAASAGGPVGAPEGGGLVVAGAIVVALLAVSARLGWLWRWRVWLGCALVFYVIWFLLYSTFFTNLDGIGSGWWQSLGYWQAQQDVARGHQPYYYYLLLAPLYEFLPMLFSLAAGVYYIRRRDRLGRFLVYWAVATFVMYTLAAEKMPWLLVNLALPMVLLAAKFMADLWASIDWRRLLPGGGLLVLAGVPLLLWALWRLAFTGLDTASPSTAVETAALVVLAVAAAGACALASVRWGWGNAASFAAVPVALVLLAVTVRVGTTAAYANSDRPVEMIVYTQSSPDIPRLVDEIDGIAASTGEGRAVPITIDGTSGFAWPWVWYLRDHTRVGYPSYTAQTPDGALDSAVVIVHGNNRDTFNLTVEEGYKEEVRIRHRWWFPEHTYRNLTFGKVARSFADRGAWRRAMDYFMHRRLGSTPGSEDAYVYIAQDLPQSFEAE